MDLLQKIVVRKREEVSRLPERPADDAVLRWGQKTFGPRRGFAEALRFPRVGPPALIAEIKKSSPSAGLIRPDFDPVEIARTYQTGGAACLSVLTDQEFFLGSLDYLRQVRLAVSLPLLRKDFIIDERQVYESLEWGADAILLIAAILDDPQLSRLLHCARVAGLAALVEVHTEAELDRAAAAGASLIGVNNRDLRTLAIDLSTTERLLARWRSAGPRTDSLLVAESGLHSRADVERVTRAGANAILVGESLMRQGDIHAKMGELLGETLGY